MTPALLIKHARQEAGLTQEQLARRLGTTQTAIARLERQGSNPRITTLERALRATGHRLEVTAAPQRASLDEGQLRRHLAMSPAGRARAHDAAYRNTRDSLRAARKVDG